MHPALKIEEVVHEICSEIPQRDLLAFGLASKEFFIAPSLDAAWAHATTWMVLSLFPVRLKRNVVTGPFGPQIKLKLVRAQHDPRPFSIP